MNKIILLFLCKFSLYFLLSTVFSSCSKSPDDIADNLIQNFREINELLEQVDSEEKFNEIEPQIAELFSEQLEIVDGDLDDYLKSEDEKISEDKKEILLGEVMKNVGFAISKKKYGYDPNSFKK